MTPNQALQRTRLRVTAPASTTTFPPTMQAPRRSGVSLSLRSLGAFAMRALLSILFCIAVGGLHAKDIEIRPAHAAEHGITITLSTPNPGVVQAVLHFATMPKEVGLVLQDSKDKFVASVALLSRGQTCVAILSEEYVSHSYFAFPYIADPNEQVYHVFLRDHQ